MGADGTAAVLRSARDSSASPVAYVRVALDGRVNALESGLRKLGTYLPGTVRVVVIHDGPGNGENQFDMGQSDVAQSDVGQVDVAQSDVGEVDVGPVDPRDDRAEPGQPAGDGPPAFEWLSRPDLLSIAVVSADAVGAGLELALACDLRIASTQARFGLGGPGGPLPVIGGLRRLTAVLGYSTALELSLTARVLSADEALGLGLVGRVAAPQELAAAVAVLVDGVLTAPRSAATELKALLLTAASNRSPAAARAGDILVSDERAAHRRLSRERAGFADG